MNEPRVTYCGNVHASEDLDRWIGTTRDYGGLVASAMQREDRAFGHGIWWSAKLARELQDTTVRQRVGEFLAELGRPIWTANVFPFGDFHAERVKTAVYDPDWTARERLDYTVDVAEAIAGVGASEPGVVVPLSTLPLGFRDADRRVEDLEPAEIEPFVRELHHLARALDRIAERTGIHFVVCLEPEPFCLLERADRTADFLEQQVFDGAPDEPLLRRHLGICIDLCHLETVGEDPVAALADLGARQIEVPKIQVSSCLQLRSAEGLHELLAFEEERYLHQTVAAGGARALDLDQVRATPARFLDGLPVHTHYHVPVFWDTDGPLGSTRASVERFLTEAEGPLPLLEVETYTWSVLGESFVPETDLAQGLIRELEFVHTVLSRREGSAETAP